MFISSKHNIYNSRNYRSLLAIQHSTLNIKYLQQQKLQKLTSPWLEWSFRISIYNSRNYRSLLARIAPALSAIRSTIVEIIEAYQPLKPSRSILPVSTIVEIIEAYQPIDNLNSRIRHLQQQKLQKLTSQLFFLDEVFISTIVEIIEAYQP